MLRRLMDLKNAGSLAFYVASLRGYRKSVFKEIPEAFEKFVEAGNWNEIEAARVSCYKRVTLYAGMLLDLYRKETVRTRLIEHIEREFSHLF